MKNVPHVIPYQGSKRKLADAILKFINFDVNKFYEPFVGSGAITLAAAIKNIGNEYIIGDKLEPLADLWKIIVNNPLEFSERYSRVWHAQLDNPIEYYNHVRSRFNQKKQPEDLLYLIARCVKNAVRFNSSGDFNQGQDKRRLGTRPDKVFQEAGAVSNLLKGKIKIFSSDFREIIRDANENDLVYMDPPWQGTSTGRDNRYAHVLDMNELINEMINLNKRRVPFMLSFDGTLGEKSYGKSLPQELNLVRYELNAGRSTQATLLGRDEVTIESLYLSPFFISKMKVKETRDSTGYPSNALDVEGTTMEMF